MTDPLHNIWGNEANRKIIAISPNSELGNLPSFQDTNFLTFGLMKSRYDYL